MKQMPLQAPGSFRPLHKMLTGAIKSRLLLGGLNLKIFDALEEWATSEQVSVNLNSDTKSTEYFMDALTNIGLLEKRGGHYRNMLLSSLYLSSSSEYYTGDLFSMIRQMSIDPLENLEEFVGKGPIHTEKEENENNPSMWVESARASMPWAVGEMGCRIARVASNLSGFTGFKKMLDLGGGHGVFALYITQASETLKSVIFDRAPVTDLASQNIKSYEMDERISVMEGDYLKDDIGNGYDLIFASATLNSVKSNPEPLISKIYNALNPNGYFMSLHDGMTHENTRPGLILEWLGGLMASGQDFRLEQGELAEIMLACGFKTVRSRTLETPIGLMELDIARK